MSDSLLDRMLPASALRVACARDVDAPPSAVFRALAETTAADLGGSGRGSSILRRLSQAVRADQPLYAELLSRGVRVLASDPLHEVVVGASPSDLVLRRSGGRRRRPTVGVGIRYHAGRLTVEARIAPKRRLARMLLRPVWRGVLAPVARPLLEIWIDAVHAQLDARPGAGSPSTRGTV